MDCWKQTLLTFFAPLRSSQFLYGTLGKASNDCRMITLGVPLDAFLIIFLHFGFFPDERLRIKILLSKVYLEWLLTVFTYSFTYIGWHFDKKNLTLFMKKAHNTSSFELWKTHVFLFIWYPLLKNLDFPKKLLSKVLK